jgi:hypothetical protein
MRSRGETAREFECRSVLNQEMPLSPAFATIGRSPPRRIGH